MPAFVTFDSNVVAPVALTDSDRQLLTEYGLPDSAAPMLNFHATPGMLGAMRSNDESPPGTERFVEIGSNGSGDPICLDIRDGSIHYLNHDSEFTPVFVNSSVTALVQTLLLYRELIQEALAANGPDAFLDGEFPLDALARTVAAIRSIDPAALDVGAMWSDDLQFE